MRECRSGADDEVSTVAMLMMTLSDRPRAMRASYVVPSVNHVLNGGPMPVGAQRSSEVAAT
jgi:hypothetical protein